MPRRYLISSKSVSVECSLGSPICSAKLLVASSRWDGKFQLSTFYWLLSYCVALHSKRQTDLDIPHAPTSHEVKHSFALRAWSWWSWWKILTARSATPCLTLCEARALGEKGEHWKMRCCYWKMQGSYWEMRGKHSEMGCYYWKIRGRYWKLRGNHSEMRCWYWKVRGKHWKMRGKQLPYHFSYEMRYFSGIEFETNRT